MKSIALIGFMGTGKSTLGKAWPGGEFAVGRFGCGYRAGAADGD